MTKTKIKLPTLTMLAILFLSLAACHSPQKLTEVGRYNDAVEKAVDKLDGKKKKAKHVEALEVAFHRANAKDITQMDRLKESDNPKKWDRVYNLTQEIKHRQELVEPLLPLIDDRGYEASFQFVKIRGLEQEAKVKAAEFHYAEAKQKLENARNGNRQAARAAFENLQSVDRYFVTYKDKQALEAEALDLGRSRILFSMENETFAFLPRGFEREMLRVGVEDMNSRWNEFHTIPQKNQAYDYEVKMRFTDIELSPEFVQERQYVDRREIEDGYDYVLDRNGNVQKDSLGNDIKVPATRVIEADVIETFQNKYAKVSGEVVIIDKRTGQIVRRAPLVSDIQFENYASTFRGDRRALSQESRNNIGNQPIPFPSDEALLLQATDELKPIVKDQIRQRNFI